MKKKWRALFCGISAGVMLWSAPQVNASPQYESAYDAYHTILTRITERVGREDYLEQIMEDDNGIFETRVYAAGPEHALTLIGFTWKDLNGDGIEELLIGRLADEGRRYDGDAGTLLAIYTYRDGKPMQVLSGWTRHAYMPMQNGLLYYYGAQGAGSVRTGVYRMDKAGKLRCEDFYFTEIDETRPRSMLYFTNTTGEDEITKGKPTPAAEFDRFCEEKRAQCVTIPMHTLLDYRDGILATRGGIRISCAITPRDRVPDLAVDEIDIDGSPGIVFSSLDPMYNFRIYKVVYGDDRVPIRMNECVYRNVETLAVCAHIAVGEAMPQYAIAYETRDGSQHYYTVHLSGEDGHLFLSAL